MIDTGCVRGHEVLAGLAEADDRIRLVVGLVVEGVSVLFRWDYTII